MLVVAETRKHIMNVSRVIGTVVKELMYRAATHDQSKLAEPEASGFEKYTPRLRGTTFLSDDYNQALEEMKPFLDHHYEHNRHHPQYFEDGVAGMNLIDLLEMVCDWRAATLRHANGDLTKSIHGNAERFNLSPMLTQILLNTGKWLESQDAPLEEGD
jgi:hypothetical protein